MRVYTAILLMLLVSGCSGDGSSVSTPKDVPPSLLTNFSDSHTLIPPADVLSSLAPRTSSTMLLQRTGSAYVPGLAQRVTAVDTSALFYPAWSSEFPGINKLAYAIYSFNVQDYAENSILQISWGEEPLDYSDLWIGFSHWSSNSWEWYPGPEYGILDLSGAGYVDYTKPGTGDMLVAVILLGIEPALLDKLQVGEANRGDWWMFGHDPRHTRRSPYVGAQTDNLRWRYRLGAVSYGSPTIGADGTVYVGCYDHKLYAVSPSGQLEWYFTAGERINSTPAIGIDGSIYFGSRDGNIYALH